MPPRPTFYVRLQMYDRFGLFDLDYKISADYDQMLRLLRQQETTVRYIPETLIQMRLGGASNQSLQSILLKSSEDYRIIQRSEEHTSELQSLMRISYAVFCLKKKKQ